MHACQQQCVSTSAHPAYIQPLYTVCRLPTLLLNQMRHQPHLMPSRPFVTLCCTFCCSFEMCTCLTLLFCAAEDSVVRTRICGHKTVGGADKNLKQVRKKRNQHTHGHVLKPRRSSGALPLNLVQRTGSRWSWSIADPCYYSYQGPRENASV